MHQHDIAVATGPAASILAINTLRALVTERAWTDEMFAHELCRSQRAAFAAVAKENAFDARTVSAAVAGFELETSPVGRLSLTPGDDSSSPGTIATLTADCGCGHTLTGRCACSDTSSFGTPCHFCDPFTTYPCL